MMRVQDYLHRIDYTQGAEPNLETLRGLQRAHMLTVPFENLDIGLGHPIQLDEQSMWKKIVVNVRGGFCYELNGLFAWLLKEIGFEVSYLNARDYHEADGTFGIDFDHLTLLVHVPNESTRWLVDVGYGDCFSTPMNVDDSQEHVEDLRGYWLEPFKDGYQLWRRNYDGSHEKQYYFDLTARHFPSDYEATCLYHQTSPDSIFTKKRIVSRLTEDGRISLDHDRLIVTKNGQREVQPVKETDRPHLLKKHFKVSI